jgi:2-polyprenyl-3-methyl-5-hydroxy-6-metoxy-1,4-benzoquinol methylase
MPVPWSSTRCPLHPLRIDSAMTNSSYVLGHSDPELARLKTQARLLEPVTRQFLRDAGIRTGMRVLDVGSGAGDVAVLAAELVGDDGEVIGTDTAAAAVTAAMHSAQVRGLRNVSFRQGDPAEMRFDRSFDAVVGRYVLLFQPDPVAMVRKLVGHVRSGGLVVFQEPDWVSARSVPPAATYDCCCGWIRETFRRAGTDSDMAAKLYATFVRAGLATPSMRMQTFIGGGASCTDFLQAVADLIRTLTPTMERLDVATATEIEVATLADRLSREATANCSVIIGRSDIAAWSRV